MYRYPRRITSFNYLNKHNQKQQYIQNVHAWEQKFNAIIGLDSVEKIYYEDYPVAFDYVDNLFQNRDVKQIVLYKVSIEDIKKYKLDHCGGFYDKLHKAIVLVDDDVQDHECNPKNKKKLWKSIHAKITLDEVIVHELLHYCFDKDGKKTCVELEEEFAYGYSLGYLYNKGYSDDYIIQNIYFPFLVMQSRTKVIGKFIKEKNIQNMKELQSYNKQIFDMSCNNAYEIGERLISIYRNKLYLNNSMDKNKGILPNENRFNFLCLD